MVQPAIPAGRRADPSVTAIENHPAALESERRVKLSALGAVIDVAELVLADALAIEPRVQRVFSVCEFHQVSTRISHFIALFLFASGRSFDP